MEIKNPERTKNPCLKCKEIWDNLVFRPNPDNPEGKKLPYGGEVMCKECKRYFDILSCLRECKRLLESL